jgi:hypothetical protein
MRMASPVANIDLFCEANYKKGRKGQQGVVIMLRMCLAILIIVGSLSACNQINPKDAEEINNQKSNPSLPLDMSPALSVNESAIESKEEYNFSLLPQAGHVQGVLSGKEQLQGMDIIPFEQIAEIIPEPKYSGLGSDLYIYTRKVYGYGDGGSIIEPFIGLHCIEGKKGTQPLFKNAIHYTIKNGFPFYSNIPRISLDTRRFIYDGFESPYMYMFHDGELEYWEKIGYREGYSLEETFPDDLSFAIKPGEESVLVNHEMGKMVLLPNFPILNGSLCLITRDHKYFLYTERHMIKKYNLMEGTISEIFTDEPFNSSNYLRLLSIKDDQAIYYERGEKQFCLNINTGVSTYVGRFMYSINESPNGKYIAYTHPSYLWVGFSSDEAFFEYRELFEGEFGYGEMNENEGGGKYVKHIPGEYPAEGGGTFVQDIETGEIVKFIPDEFVIGWFCE